MEPENAHNRAETDQIRHHEQPATDIPKTIPELERLIDGGDRR